jgi:VWFA-related protein
MRRLRHLALILSLPFLSPVVSAGSAQEPPAAEPSSIYGDVIDVRVVNVEVVVTDRQGNRVTDLAPGDFRLKVDGKEVPIEFFTEVRAGSAVAPAAESGTGGPAAVEPGGRVSTNYLVFIDNYFATELRRNEVLHDLKAQLSHLQPEDRMAIVAWDGGKVSVVSNWSGSPNDLARAFDVAMGAKARGLDRVAELRTFRNDQDFRSQIVGDGAPLSLESRFNNAGLNEQERAYADQIERQVEGGVSAAVSALRGVAPPAGRKVMLLLSGGWPYSITSFIRGEDPVATGREVKDGEELFRPLSNTANLLGYTIYPVDVPGVETAAADSSSFGAAAGGSFPEQEIEGSLRFLAEETGGTALVNSNRNQALVRTSADLSSYYWFGFTPTWQRNDERHKVEVEVLRPGLQARSRNGFLDLSRKAEVSMKVESALLFGGFPGAAPLPLKLGEVRKARRGQIEIPLTLGLPSDILTVIPHEGKFAAELELRVAASDAGGNSSDIPVIPLTISGDKPPKPGGFVRYDTKITLNGKAETLVLAVYDPVSGKMATGEVKVPAQ